MHHNKVNTIYNEVYEVLVPNFHWYDEIHIDSFIFFFSYFTLSPVSFRCVCVLGHVLFFLVLFCFLVNECCLIKSVGKNSAGVLRFFLCFVLGKAASEIHIDPKKIQFWKPMPRCWFVGVVVTLTLIFSSSLLLIITTHIVYVGLICLLLFILWLQSAYD